MALMFVLGFFLDFIEIVFVVVPIIAPVLIQLGADPIWLGVMIAINLQTSFLTPPFGFALFYLRGVAPPVVDDGGHLSRRTSFCRLAVAAFGCPVVYSGGGDLAAEKNLRIIASHVN